MSNETNPVYQTTREFTSATKKQVRSSIRRMTRTNSTHIEFNFSDGTTTKANRLFVRLDLNLDVISDKALSTEAYMNTRIEKIMIREANKERFVTLSDYHELYSKIFEFYSL